MLCPISDDFCTRKWPKNIETMAPMRPKYLNPRKKEVKVAETLVPVRVDE